MIRRDVRRFFQLALRRRDRWEREVEDEIMLHLTLRAEQLVERGHSVSDAYAEAVRRFGPLTESRARLLDAARHREHRMQRTEYFSDLRNDAAFAVRTLVREKTWTAVTLLTFALGISATTTVFSVVNTLIIHPISYPNADRVVLLFQQPSSGNNTGIPVTILPATKVIRTWRAGAHGVEGIEGFYSGTAAMRTSGDPASVLTGRITPGFVSFAGERPVVGRMFSPAEAATNPHVVLLGESIWRQRFGADRGVVGKYITLDDQQYAIIGVLPATLQLPNVGGNPRDMWLPLNVDNDSLGMTGIARLRTGVDAHAAMRELDSLYARANHLEGGKIPFTSVVMRPSDRLQFRDSLFLLSFAVALVLIVACTNVAHLVLARSSTRQRELAIRTALGAGRSRIVRQLLTESAVLSFAGTVLGVFFGWMGLKVVIALRPSTLDALKAAHVDGMTLALAILVGAACTFVFAIASAMRSTRRGPHDALKTGAATTSASRTQRRARGLLVVTEMALSAVLIVGATMLVRSVANLQREDLGFEPRGLYAIQVPLDAAHIDGVAAQAAFTQTFLERVRQIPSITSASAASAIPGWFYFSIGRLEVQGQPAPPVTSSSFIAENQVENGFFATMHTPIVRGTLFTDTTQAAGQVIVNAAFAQRTWPNGDAIGKHIRVAQSGKEPWLTVVGIARDTRTGGPLAESSAPLLYLPPRERTWSNVIVRTTGGAASLAPAISLLKQMGIQRPKPPESAEQMVAKTIDAPRFVMRLLAVFSVLALIIAAIGMYGVMSYRVAQSTREIGIRIALGATSGRIGRAVVGSGVALALAGAVAGLGLASWSTRVIQSQLHGVSRLDPVAFSVGAVVLVGVAAVACLLPARRALTVDPMTAIRAE